MKKLLVILLIGIGVCGYIQAPSVACPITEESIQSEQVIAEAHRKRLSNIQVGGSGKVIHILPDDNEGSHHQRFILLLSSGQTLLIAHNIDLAPKISTLQKGDVVQFFGEYEWNAKGGVIHWTHHDSDGRHIDGWLKHKGIKYK